MAGRSWHRREGKKTGPAGAELGVCAEAVMIMVGSVEFFDMLGGWFASIMSY